MFQGSEGPIGPPGPPGPAAAVGSTEVNYIYSLVDFVAILITFGHLETISNDYLKLQGLKGEKGEPGNMIGPDGSMLHGSGEKGEPGNPGERVSCDITE